MGTLIELPLNSGMDQGVDRTHGDGRVLQYAQNCRLTRDGRLEPRPGFTQLSSTNMSGGPTTFYDLTNHQGRLIALGDQVGAGRATDLFEWLPTANKWRATAGANTDSVQGPRLPQVTDVRGVGALPDQFLAVNHVRLAAGGGYVCAIVNYLSGTTVTVHIFDPLTNQTLFCGALALKFADVVYSGTKFWIVGIDANDDAAFVGFDPSTDTALASLTVDTALATSVDISACNFGTGWAYGVAHSTAVTVKTKTSAGAAGTTITVASSSGQDCVALAGNTAGTFLSVAMRATSGGNIVVNTYTSAGVLQAGPTTAFPSTTVSRLAMSINGSASSFTIMGCTGANSNYREYTQSAHVSGSSVTYFDARLTCQPAEVSGKQFAVFVDREANDDEVGTHHLVELDNLIPQAFLQPQLASTGSAAVNACSKAAFSGTKLYFPITTILQDLGTGTRKVKFAIYECETSGTGRRQMASVGGELLIAGGLPLTYDGRVLAEQGFAERPVVESVTQAATGSLTLLGVYNAIPLWEVFDGKGRLVRSQAGSPRAVTLTGANNSITWTVTTPHSLRRHPAFRDQAFSVRVSIYRSEAGEGIYFIDKQTTIDPLDDVAEFVTLTSTQSDTALIDNTVLYEQGQTPLSHVAPSPYRYVWPARDRALAGGQPDPETWTESKLFFPGEPVTWASPNQLGFSGRVNGLITAVAALETVGIAWTEQEIWQIPGRGPEHDGTGDFDAAARIPSPGGCIDWRSVLVAPPGAFFQMRADQLMLLAGGTVQWAGLPIQDSLASFPVIVGAVYVRALDQVVFACNSADGSAGVFLVLDLTVNQWFIDTLPSAIRSVSELGGRLVYVDSAGAVWQQNAAPASGVGALPTVQIDTRSQRPFGATGRGDLEKIQLLATFVGACTVEAFISYDDGATYTSMGSYTITQQDASPSVANPSGVAAGMVCKQWDPKQRTTDRFSVRIQVSNATDTGGLRMHYLTYEAVGLEGAVRRPAVDRR